MQQDFPAKRAKRRKKASDEFSNYKSEENPPPNTDGKHASSQLIKPYHQ